MIRILTDSASDILPAEAEQLGVTVIPLNVTLEADQLSSSAMMNTTSVYIHHLRGRDSYFSRIEFEYCMISLR